MAKYIEKSMMKQYIKNFCQGLIEDNRRFDPVDDCALLCDVVNFAPAADVAKVKHGHWETLKLKSRKRGYVNAMGTELSSNRYRCSICHVDAECDVTHYSEGRPTSTMCWELTAYCPHCGAKMDGK